MKADNDCVVLVKAGKDCVVLVKARQVMKPAQLFADHQLPVFIKPYGFCGRKASCLIIADHLRV